MTEIKQGLRALRLGASGGPDGITTRLLNNIAKLLPGIYYKNSEETGEYICNNK